MAKDDRDELYELRHDAAHVMATAVAELYPGTRLSIGPPIEDGFYYDFEFPDGDGPGEGVETVSLYRNGPFEDLCRGPHGPSTGRIEAFKLNSLAGAYWRGDETRQMLTRIYGTAFFTRQDLEEHVRMLEEARARDHRKLGPQLGLFLLREEAPGMPFWLPDGTVLLRNIEGEVRRQL